VPFNIYTIMVAGSDRHVAHSHPASALSCIDVENFVAYGSSMNGAHNQISLIICTTREMVG
jgi:hypothetical protein